MMKVHLKTLEGCLHLLEIRAEPEEVKAKREEVLRDLERVARVPGFREGKAPRHLVEQRYGKEGEEELLKRLIPELYQKALQELHLDGKVLSLPEISDVQFKESDLFFKAKLEVKPEIPLRKYKGLKASRKPVTVSPEEIERELVRLQEERAELIPKEGAVEENDFVVCDVEGRVDGKVTESRKNVLIMASDRGQKHPEIAKALFGATRGQTRETELTLESPGGVVQKTHYQLRVNEIKKRVLPELNDEWVKTVTSFQNLGELKAALDKELKARKEEAQKINIEKELLEGLSLSCSFALPRTLVEKEFRRLVEEELFRFRILGMPEGEMSERIKQNQELLLRESERRVRHSLILEKVAETEKLEISPREVDERIQSLSDRLQRSDEERKKDLENRSLRHRIEGEILFEKALSVIVENAQIKDAA